MGIRSSKIIAITVSLICIMLLCSCGPDPGTSESYHAEGAENYNKDVIIEKYSGDLDSDTESCTVCSRTRATKIRMQLSM